jgi:hypothetical protein
MRLAVTNFEVSTRGNLTRAGRMLLVGLLTASSLVAMSVISREAAESTPHVGSTCDQTAAFPYGSAVVGIAESGGGGYWIVTNDGYVAACGDAPYLGQQTTLNGPIVGIAATPDGGGYYLVASDGGVFTFGDAEFQGSPGATHLNTPVIGMAVDPTTGGYWLVATDGGIFAYGAPFLGSTGSMTLNRPVTGMAAASDGTGYWLAASDGGVFAFGVPFLGSTGSIPLNSPVVGMASDAETGGYWLVASDGGIFSYRTPFYGSAGSIVLNRPIAGMEAAAGGSGYRLIGTDGGVFTYGSSGFYGTPAFAPPPPAQVTAVGDSIMVDYQDPLKTDIPGVIVDAAVGRQWTTGESILQGMRSEGRLGREVIVALGTNGPISDADFDTMMSILGGASKVVFVNVHVDRPWQDPNNAVLARGAVRYPGVLIADWATLAAQNPQWFGADGTHLAVDGSGAVALASLIATTLSKGSSRT